MEKLFKAQSFKEKIKLLPKEDLQLLLSAIDRQSASDETGQPSLKPLDLLEELSIK